MSFRFASLLALVVAAPLHAQAPAPCETGPITDIYVNNQSIFDISDPDLDDRLNWAYRLANRLHIRTRESVILRELLFVPGSCYNPYMLSESERILRQNRFLAKVDVFGVRQPDDSWHVFVNTFDEWSTRPDVRVTSDDGLRFEGFRFEEVNLLGTGRTVGGYYFDRDAIREYGFNYFAPQLFGTRWDLDLGVARSRAGTRFYQQVAYPFVGEVSDWAARQSYLRDDRYFDYIVGPDHVLQPVRESFSDLAVVRRIGERGATTVVGAGVSFQKLNYPGAALFLPRGDYELREPVDSATRAVLLEQRNEVNVIRANVMLGQRNIWYETRRGLDSMRGEEDVRLGAEATIALGRALPAFEVDDDLAATLTLYSAFDVGDALVVVRGRGDARRDLAADANEREFEDVYSETEAMAYLQTRQMPRHTFFFRVATSAAWNPVTPFQLTLGGLRGVRGYRPESFPGGGRLVATVEDRIFFGWPFPDLADVGGTLFVDGGRTWQGDVPFGVDSGWRAAVGAGLRVSFPAGGRSVARLDFALPVEDGIDFSNVRVLISIGEIIGLSANAADRQLIRSRRESVAGDLFTPRF